MTTFRRILVATDFGAAAETACDDAVRLGKLFDARLDLVHVDPIRTPVTGAQGRLERVRDTMLERGANVGELVAARGSAAEAILHSAETLGHDLIVIAAGDRSRTERSTGPTAETVAGFARVPVWVSRHDGQLRRVLCAVDRSEASREALRVALELAERARAELSVVHVLGSHESGTTARAGDDDRVLADLASFLGLAPDFALVAAHGRPSETLAELARREHCDVLVLGRGGVGGLRRVFMGATAERLLRRAPCSLLLTSPAPSQ